MQSRIQDVFMLEGVLGIKVRGFKSIVEPSKSRFIHLQLSIVRHLNPAVLKGADG